MFKRTRIQLTIRNAAVLSVILLALHAFVYFVMKDMMFNNIDKSLMGVNDKLDVTTPMPALPGEGSTLIYQVGQMNRPVFQLFWTKEKEPIQTPGNEMFGAADWDKLQPDKIGTAARTVKLGDQYYRVFNSAKSNSPTLIVRMGDKTQTSATRQLLTNISAEISMLYRLKLILLTGGFVGLLVAVATGYYLANRALIPIRVSLEKQQQFVSDASHELRTPLSVIQAHTELLLRHPDHTIEQDSKHVSTVLQETKRMSKLVSGLLTLARSDSNQLELDKRPVQLDRIVSDSLSKMTMLAEVKHISLRAEIEPSVSIHADEERLHQLLTALLDNAVKYTPEGGSIRISCRMLSQAVQLEVEDTGIGIAAEHLPRIFDRFYRGEKARTRQEGGTGLGLAIAKWIVERHGGRIRAESKLGVGTRITVTMPYA
ncbi:phospho-acceptor domain-containing protein [Paenibacillus cellulosilyticus]|uniref:histidine kinase n=1 Tax=Paenibacillus cellulosilyticus TaxID=375489 RepID=A0A2V2YQI0_9BACL|nr:ATP-binding protein [Paenibacillus cellulosilyticus]PWV98686.1 phospho-acceptor domain-containing protein [Paenibacillus cellulosilyticus]QKS43811.1 sensor histidine kinase [Paenibacillus cellulosilyticus]